MDEDFKEKIDAMRMTLELATRDIEELRTLSASQAGNIQALMKISGDLLETARSHERRISGLEGRR